MTKRLVLLSSVLIAAAIAAARTGGAQQPTPDSNAVVEETAWMCPMHPDYTVDVDGRCPRCGMALVRAAPFDVRDYELDFRSIPPVVRPQQKATLQFRVRHPGTGDPISKFGIVHEKPYHLFVISQDMTFFSISIPRKLGTARGAST